MQNSLIEWCYHTFNPWWGCEKASAGCAHCYATGMAARFGWDVFGKGKPYRILGTKNWEKPLAWDRLAKKAEERHRVFCGSMMDVFQTGAPEREREKLWDAIKATPNLDWMLLTKRPENILAMLPDDWGEGYPNVMLGASVEGDTVAWRIEELAKVPAWLRFLSIEPLIEPLTSPLTGIHWALVGGESGPGCRPMEPWWALEVRDNARAAGAAFFLKQLGGFPDKRGKEKALLDGKLYHELPPGVTSQSVGF